MLPVLLDLGWFPVSFQNEAEKKQAYEREGQMGHRDPPFFGWTLEPGHSQALGSCSA